MVTFVTKVTSILVVMVVTEFEFECWSQLPVFLGWYSYAYVPEALCYVDGSHLVIVNSLLSFLALTNSNPHNNLNIILNVVHSMQRQYVLFTKPTAVVTSCTDNYIMHYRKRSIMDQDQC